MADATAKSGNYTSAYVFAAITALCVAATLVCLPSPNQESSALFTGILALIFGNMSFTRFEKASAPGPPPQEFHKPETITTKLKDGSEVTFIIQILFVAANPSPTAMDQIQYRVLRRLNETIPLLDALYDNPLPVTDRILQNDVPDLCKELSLEKLTLRTLEVASGNAQTTHHSQGIFFGDHPA